MATQVFSSSNAPMSVFRKKKPEEQQVDWSQYQSRPSQTTTQTPKQVIQSVMTPSWKQTTTKQPVTWQNVNQRFPSQSNVQKQIPPPTTPPPGTTPPPTTKTDPTGINPLIAKAREIAQRQAGFYSDQADKQVTQLGEQQGIRQKYADTRVSKLEALRDAAIGRINETVPLQEQATNEYKTQVEDQYGRQMKEQAQAQREEQQGIQDLFSGLNTVDSGAFITQGMKSRERLTANQSATITARTNELNTADRDLKQYKLQAQGLIANEVQKFDDALLTIAENLEVGSAEYNAAVKQVYAQAQEAILGLESGLADKELAYEEKAQALQADLLKEQMKNGTSTANSAQAKQNITSVVDQLLAEDTNPITGALRLGGVIPGGRGQVVQGLYDQLVAMLSLDNREKLKGSGAISDFEAQVLQKAASRLRPGMGDQDFRQALQQIKTELGGVPTQQTSSTMAPNSTNDPLGLRG